MDYSQIKELLDDRYLRYNVPEYIDDDPIQIPHLFSGKEDIEISGFLSASIAWGLRKIIINNSMKLMQWMDHAPYDFVMNAGEQDLKIFGRFVHRTFNGTDCLYFIRALQNIYTNHGGLEAVFQTGYHTGNGIYGALEYFRTVFLAQVHQQRTEKHLADVTRNASAKRLNMYLRWMVRRDKQEVDFGLWNNIPASSLMLPLDIHTGNVARALGILQRTQNDWKSVQEVTDILRQFDPEDPVKYDYAMFGMGLNGELK